MENNIIADEVDKQNQIGEDISKYKGLRGWLILVAIFLFLSAIGLIYNFIRIILELDYSGIGELFVYDLITVGGLIVLVLYLFYLFFGKSRKFPKLFVLFLIVSVIENILNILLVLFYGAEASALGMYYTRVGVSLLLFIIFGLYIKKSKRVEATFIEENINRKGLIIGIILISAITVGIILAYSRIKNVDGYNSIMSAMLSDKKLKCTYSISENGETSNATVLVNGMKFNHTEYLSDGNIREVFDGNTLYSWSEEAKKGIFINQECLKNTGIRMEDYAIPEAYSFEDDRIHCELVDSVDFSVPKDIEFRDTCENFLKTLN